MGKLADKFVEHIQLVGLTAFHLKLFPFRDIIKIITSQNSPRGIKQLESAYFQECAPLPVYTPPLKSPSPLLKYRKVNLPEDWATDRRSLPIVSSGKSEGEHSHGN